MSNSNLDKLNSKKTPNEEGTLDVENAFLFIIDQLRNALLGEPPKNIEDFKSQINLVYLRAETANLRYKLHDTEYCNVRIVFRTSGKFAFRDSNTHVPNEVINLQLGSDALFYRLEAMSNIYKAACCLIR